ncbi:3913_t:CDS:2 [Funneliformis caledonium]|uniref:3913_t:CDS:1 n=1 Tax=Funneliformis caledonium TaxID=1117310 RepID=A0A9N8ZWS0_9GLOM|nr:3913_t:CDS:2 [Funneliformis caledonium]
MIASERSASTAKWCLVLIDELLQNMEVQEVSSEATSIKKILANASKRKSRSRSASLPTKKGIAGAIAAPVARSDATKKTVAVQPIEALPKSKSSINKTQEAALSMFAELSLRKAEKCRLPKEQKSRPLISSSLGQNRSKDWKSMNICPSKRYSTLATESAKRTTSMKLINSTTANRMMRRVKAKKQQNDIEMKHHQKSTPKPKSKPELQDKNLNLSHDRPLLSQRPRTVHLNKSPAVTLQNARKVLKVMMKIRKHRNTI